MTDRNFDNFSHVFNKWQRNIINFTIKRNLANKELEKYIKSVPTIDSEIYRALFTAKEYYTHKLRYYNRKIKRLKKKEVEFKQLLVYVKREKRNLLEPKVKDEISTSIRKVKQSIKEIDNKIYNLSNQIEEEALDVDEESSIIEDIKNSDQDKKIYVRHLRKLGQDLLRELKNNAYFKAVRTIEILEINLNEISRILNEFSRKKIKNHRKMLDLCRKAKFFDSIKKQIENELLGAKRETDRYHQLYFELKNQSKKNLREDLLRQFKNSAKTKG